jgi:hypothetical protein
MVRWLACVVVLGACTAANPEFGLDASSSGSTAALDSSGAASSSGPMLDTGVDVSSSDGGTVSMCGPPGGLLPTIRLEGNAEGAATHGAIRLVGNNRIEINCDDPCITENTTACTPLAFEVSPPLWGGWEPPLGCFRFQWASNDLQVIDELRIGIEGQSDTLTVLGAAPLVANAFDVELEMKERCACEAAQCCPPESGEYVIVVHGEEDVRLGAGESKGDVAWMQSAYRVENIASSIVPSCETPVRMQFRAYRKQ